MSDGKVYDLEYKIQAVKLANEIGQAKAATELGIPNNAELVWRDFSYIIKLLFDYIGLMQNNAVRDKKWVNYSM